jgi:carbonic anhydrase
LDGKVPDVLLFLVLVVLLIAGAVGVFYLLQKQRRQGFERAAREMGFTFSPTGDGGIVSRLGRFHLFSQGRGHVVRNLIEGSACGCEVKIFDYEYSRRDDDPNPSQTVIYFHAPELRLPTFSLRPKQTLHKIAAWFGYQEITFAGYPFFQRNYLLRGPDEPAIRNLFDEEVVAFFDGYLGVSAEGSGPLLIFYRAGEHVAPERLRAFLEEGFTVLALFR